jgi:hypothetical protein
MLDSDRPEQSLDRSPYRRCCALYVQSFDFAGSQSKRGNCASDDEAYASGRSARHEANLMVSEKIKAIIDATASLAAGAIGDEIVHRYRQHVANNAKRLPGRSRKRTRRRSK